jgi:hypothetical protein
MHAFFEFETCMPLNKNNKTITNRDRINLLIMNQILLNHIKCCCCCCCKLTNSSFYFAKCHTLRLAILVFKNDIFILEEVSGLLEMVFAVGKNI